MASSVVLVERSFEIAVPVDRAWDLLAQVERWPEWAPHIRTAHVEGAPVGARSEGWFRFRPVGSAHFAMTTWRPPMSWTWRGRALGLSIDYHHHFQAVGTERTRLTWVVELADGGPGLRAKAFARTYGRNVDRAWPSFVAWAEDQAGR